MTFASPDHDVIIAGAGPVGLFLACELALAGCSVLVLEKAAAPSSPLKRMPFGLRGLSAPSIEAFDRRGLLEDLAIHHRLKNPFAAPATPHAKRQAGHFAGILFHHDDIDTAQWPWRLPASLPASLLSEMEELETVLARRAQSLGVDIRRGLAIAGVEQVEEGVTVDAGGHAFTSRWLVGCDGARSTVRKALDVDFAGTEPAFTGYTLQVELDAAVPLPPGRNVTARGMFFQSQPGFVMLQDFDGGAFHDAGVAPTLEHVQAVLRRIAATGVTVRTLHAATTWTDRARQATAYRQGRVLLAGDAAHIHAPLGGQGLNLGLGDAMNLGWKLAATVRGSAPPDLLDSYHAERHPVGTEVLDWSRAQVAVMAPDATGHALHAIMRDLLATVDGATYVAGRVWGLHTRYDLGDGHPLAGRSLPNFVFAGGGSVGAALRGGRGLLLDFAGDAALAALAGGYGAHIDYRAGPVDDSLGVNALLVRPDGIVAWARGGADADHAGLQRALDRFIVRPAP